MHGRRWRIVKIEQMSVFVFLTECTIHENVVELGNPIGGFGKFDVPVGVLDEKLIILQDVDGAIKPDGKKADVCCVELTVHNLNKRQYCVFGICENPPKHVLIQNGFELPLEFDGRCALSFTD